MVQSGRVALARRSPLVSVITDLKAEPEQHWEGVLKGEHGSAKTGRVEVKARLRFQNAVLDGRGVTHTFPTRLRGQPCEFDVSGVIEGDGDLAFQLWFIEPEIGHVPFELEGALSSNGARMTGAWTCACFYPDRCGCGGGGGSFRLKKVKV